MGKEREMGWMENEQHKEENRSSSVFFLEEMLVDVGQGGGQQQHIQACQRHVALLFVVVRATPCFVLCSALLCVLFAMLSVRLHDMQQGNTSD